jgi:hypothetical protein
MDQLKPTRIFISYAHEDANWVGEFERMFAPACAQRHIEVWSDKSIVVGEEWSTKIQQALGSAQVGLLLVSDHMGSRSRR